MKYAITGLNIKVLFRALQFLARIGDEIHFETFASGLVLSSVNSRKTAYGSVKFEVDFFAEYEDDLGKEDETQCKVSIKVVLPLFRSLKQMERGSIRLDPKSCKLVFKFVCRQKVTKTHSVPILDFSRIDELVIPDTFSNKITGSHKLMSGILGNFHKSTREISFNVKKDSITIKNHIDNEETDHEAIRSNYTLRIDEFDTFAIKQNCDISFTYADFRAMCHFAEASEAFVRISFEAPGEPLCMSCRDQDLFVANLLMATMLHDMEDTCQDVLRSTSHKSKSQTNNDIEDTEENTEHPERRVKRKRRIIDTQNDENPFNFMNDKAVPEPEVPRNRKTVVSDRPSAIPSFVPAATSSSSVPSRKSPTHVSPTNSHDLFVLNRKPSSYMPIPPYTLLPVPESVPEPVPDPVSEPIPPKESEEIFFETEESEPKNNEEVVIPESAAVQGSAPQEDEEVIIPESAAAPEDSEPKRDEDVAIVESEEEDVPSTPPSSEFLRRRRYIFARCFDATFDMRAVPGANEILAPNSDGEDEGERRGRRKGIAK